MKKPFLVLFIISFFLACSVCATIADDLTTAVINDDTDGLIAVIDNAAVASYPLSNMLSAASTALNNTTAPAYNNTTRRYLYDFRYRPYIDSISSTVLYVDQFLFDIDQIGVNQSVIITSDRIIFKTIQLAMDYISNSPEISWTVIVNQAFYNENINIPASKNIVITGVGGVVIGNGLGDQFSSSVPRTITWNIADNSLNNCSLKIQSTPYGCDTYRNFAYTRFLIGNIFVTNIVSPITVAPTLEFDSVYPWGGMGAAPSDIGNINMTLRNVRMGGAVNLTSASIQEIETVLIVSPVVCKALGKVTHNVFYDNWTINDLFTETLIDCGFGATSKSITLLTTPYELNLNSSTYYWWNNKTWSPGGSTVLVPQPLQ